MNMNPSQQNRPNLPWAPPGQGQNFGFQSGPPGNQNMQQGMAYGPPKSSNGPYPGQPGTEVKHQVPMFGTQNGSVTPPSSLNPGLNSRPGQQQHVNQMNNQMAGMQINQNQFPGSQGQFVNQPGPPSQSKAHLQQNFPPPSTGSGPQGFGGAPPSNQPGPPGGQSFGPPSSQAQRPHHAPPGVNQDNSFPGQQNQLPPSSQMGTPYSGPGMPMSNVRPPFSSHNTAASSMSASSLSGPPIAGQPPTVGTAGGRPGPGQYQQRPSYPGQGITMPGQPSSQSMGPPDLAGQPMRGTTGNMSVGMPGGMPGSMPGSMPGGMPGSMPGSMAGGMPGSMPGGMPGSMPGGMPGSMPGGMPGSMPGGMPGSMPGGMPGSMPGGMPGSMPGGIPGRMGMPGQMGPGGGPINSPMQQPPKKIDPDQMPSPIQVMNDDQDQWRDTAFQTSLRGKLPPLITSHFKVQDGGNCSPRYMRSTMYNIPCNQDMLKESNVPLAIMAVPFAKIPEDEVQIHTVDHGPTGPVRCNRCKAYMNPFMQFIDGGRRFVCNICSHSSEVPADYFCHLDHQGRRVDIYERPELCYGSIEYVATTDYCKDEKFPSPPAFIFMIDVSYQSIQCGMVKRLTKELHTILDNLPKEAGMEESLIRVGFVTYSNNLHFYNIKDNLAQPQMMVVSDVNDVFVPLVDGLLVDVKKARLILDSLLDMIPEVFSETRETEVLLGPVVQAGMEALKAANVSGKVFVFHSSLPTAEAPGKLKNREDRKLLATDKEKTILSPQIPYYHNLAKTCVSNAVSVDLFLFPNSYIDVATIGLLATQTGGQIYRYSYFKDATHGKQFIEDLKKNFERDIGFDGIMRLRCSTGLRPVEFFGSFTMNNTTDVELASIDSDKAISIEIKHDDKIPEDGVAFVQCALLYTSVAGQRKLRVHNLSFNCCSQLAELYRCCELDTLTNYLLKHSLRQVLSVNPQTIRESLVQRCAHILSCYRQHCATPSTSGQLILPECMKLLPLYMNSLIKCDILAGGSEMSSDDRAFLMQAALSMNTCATVPYIYPRLFPLHNIDVDHDLEILPDVLRCSTCRIEDSGVYLLENGITMFIWVGLQVSADILQQLFHANTIGQVDIEMTQLPDLDTPLSKRVRAVIAEIQAQRQRYLKLTVVRQRDKLEPWLKHYLVEDKGFHANHMSYVDFLCHIHKEIRNLLN